MSKAFLYFESTEGGMETHEFTDKKDFPCLLGWMREPCKNSDMKLLSWMETCEVGEYYSHRLGYAVRVIKKETE
jgi:hypothetical protein